MVITLVSFWVLTTISLYFSVFNGGLSNTSGDWGSFGSYLSGVITVPFSILSAYFLFQTYKDSLRSYRLAVEEKEINISHQAIREAAEFLERSLDTKIYIEDKEISFREVNYNPRAARELMGAIKNHDDLNTHYRVTVGKSFLCLYDFLRASERRYGQTDIIRFFKIRYQWIITLHNTYELGIIEIKESEIMSKDIENYFYGRL